MKQMIETQLATTTAVTANSAIPLGSVVHRNGCDLSAGGTALNVKGAGYFKITANVTLEPSAVAKTTISLNENGTSIAIASGTPAVANDSINLSLIGIVYNPCGCANDTITVSTDSAGTVVYMNVIAERM